MAAPLTVQRLPPKFQLVVPQHQHGVCAHVQVIATSKILDSTPRLRRKVADQWLWTRRPSTAGFRERARAKSLALLPYRQVRPKSTIKTAICKAQLALVQEPASTVKHQLKRTCAKVRCALTCGVRRELAWKHPRKEHTIIPSFPRKPAALRTLERLPTCTAPQKLVAEALSSRAQQEV